MTVRFITPPKAQQLGGIENAVEGLREALLAAAVPVEDGASLDDPRSVHHFHGLWNLDHSRLAAKLRKLGRAYVISPHGMLEPWAIRHRGWKKHPYFALIEHRFLKKAAAIFVTSAMERRNLLRLVDHPNVIVLPLGCRDPRGPDYHTARERLGWEPSIPRLVFLSRIHPKKGLDLLFPALARTDLAAAGWRLAIVGDGDASYLEKLRRLQHSFGSRIPPVDWIGPIWGGERWSYLQAADLFCLPTFSENFGIAVLEAMHAGTPVITTKETPWSETDRAGGLFISEVNESSLAACITDAASGHKDWALADRQGLSDWANSTFGWSSLAPQYEASYLAVLERSPKGPLPTVIAS